MFYGKVWPIVKWNSSDLPSSILKDTRKLDPVILIYWPDCTSNFGLLIHVPVHLSVRLSTFWLTFGFKVLLEWMSVLVRNGHFVRKKQYTKNPNLQNMSVESRSYRWKQNAFNDSSDNVQHFPPVSSRMYAELAFVIWRHREHGDSNKRWRQRRFEPSQETGVKKNDQMAICTSEYPIKSTRMVTLQGRTALQRHIRPSHNLHVCRSDNFSCKEYPENYQK